MMYRLLFGFLALTATGCATTFPRLSLAAQMRLDEETHLTSLPSGQAALGDDTIRVVSNRGLCSGVVVSDALVLTAQHCVRQAAPVRTMDAGDLRVELGAAALPWGRVGVRHIETCDGYDPGHGSGDVAVLVLDTRLPADVPQASLGTPETGQKVTAMGYGTGSRLWQIPDLQAREVPTVPLRWTRYGTASRFWQTPDFRTREPHPIVAFTSTRMEREGAILWTGRDTFGAYLPSNHGDSGGPVFASDGRLIGIVSGQPEGDGPEAELTTVAARIDSCENAVERARTWEAQVPRLRS